MRPLRVKHRSRALLLPAALFAVASLLGQSVSNLRERTFLLDTDSVRLDTVSIAPGSVTLWRAGGPVDPAAYRVDPYGGWLIRVDSTLTVSVTARWRALPLQFTGTRRHKDPERLERPYGDRPDHF